MSKKRLLIISAEFPPSATVSAKRPAKVAARIAEFGWEPYVLTMAPGCSTLMDPSQLTDRLRAVPIQRVPCRSLWMHSTRWPMAKPGLPRLMAMGGRVIAKLTGGLSPTDKYYPWPVVATAAAVRMIRDYGIDAIWASAPPLSGLDLAYRAHARTGVPFVADFRDVATVRPGMKLPFQRRRALRRQDRIVGAAAGITYCAPFQIRSLIETCPGAAGKPAELVWNWFERERVEAAAPHAFGRATILHAGRVYPEAYRFEGLFEALAKLRAAGKEVQLVLVGPTNYEDRLAPRAKDHGVEDLVRFEDAVPEGQFRSYCRGSEVLLLMVGRFCGLQDFANVIPAKLCEYFGSGRPILVVGPEGSESAQIVRRLRRGLCVSDDDSGAIAEALGTLLDPQNNQDAADLSPETVREFEADGALAKLSEFLTSVACPRQGGGGRRASPAG